MKALLFPLALCLALTACAAPAGTREAAEPSEGSPLTAEEAREVLAQALLERDSSYLSYDPETGFETEDLHFVWSDVFWNEEVSEAAAGDIGIYRFDLVFGPDADDGRSEDAGNPMAGRLCASYGVGKDGNSLWQYRQDLGEWEALNV